MGLGVARSLSISRKVRCCAEVNRNGKADRSPAFNEPSVTSGQPGSLWMRCRKSFSDS